MGGAEIKDRLHIILPGPQPDEVIRRIEKKFPEIEVTFENPPGNPFEPQSRELSDPSVFADKTILVTFDTLPKPEEAPKLELIHFPSAGINHIADRPIYTDTDITLTTSNGIHGPQIAEWVFLTALVHSHEYNKLHDSQKAHEWKRPGGRNPLVVQDLPQQRIGILGYGSIGRQVARLSKAAGMEVLAYTATPKDTPEKRRDSGYRVPNTGDPEGEYPSEWYSGLDKKSLHHFLSQNLDYLVISLPLTNDTLHMLGKVEFDILSKRKTFVSNISRGQIIVQSDLIDALKADKLRGAALDVTDPEPAPKDDPIWDAPNIIVTPHVSGNSLNYWNRAFGVLELNLERRRNGEKLVNVVDRRRGY